MEQCKIKFVKKYGNMNSKFILRITPGNQIDLLTNTHTYSHTQTYTSHTHRIQVVSLKKYLFSLKKVE